MYYRAPLVATSAGRASQELLNPCAHNTAIPLPEQTFGHLRGSWGHLGAAVGPLIPKSAPGGPKVAPRRLRLVLLQEENGRAASQS